MKFTIEQNLLVPPLQLISGAVEKRQTLPVLANLLIRVENGQLTITATDLEIEMTFHFALNGESQEGDITVPARKLVDICRSLSIDSLIEFNLVSNRLKIKSGKSQFSLSTIPAQEFPDIEDGIFTTRFEITSQILKSLIEKTQFAMAQQDVRYYLNGMLLELDGDTLLTVATDGHRLALSKLKLNQTVTDSLVQLIVPRKGILEVSKLLSTTEQTCLVEINNNHIRVSLTNFVFTSKLVDGRFPDYDKVLPRNAKRILLADRELIRESFFRAAILCNEKFRGVRVRLSKDKLAIHANNPEQEEAEIELEVDYSDQDMEIGFNVNYVIEALNAIKTDTVKFNLGDSSSSVLIESSTDSDSLYVVMPMRL